MALTFDVIITYTGNESADIDHGELTVTSTLDGVTTTNTVNVNNGDASVSGFSGDDGSTVDLSFVWVDDAGNRSTSPSTLNATLTDTIPPSNPGDLGINVTGET